MATLYPRKNRWWIAWYEDGRRHLMSTGVFLADRAKAEAFKAQLERELKARKEAGLATPGVVGAYLKHWLGQRAADGKDVTDDAARLKHVRELSRLRLDEVTAKHVRELVLGLKRSGKLAPRTVRHVYAVLRMAFRDAVADGLIPTSPCVLKAGDLPAKKDASPTWRAGAVFTREEAQRLMSDSRVPPERRVLYTLLFCSGLRIGEAAALRWRHYEPDMKPLGRLLVAMSYNRKKKAEKGVKSEGQTRQVPVHPTLAAALAQWKLAGWAEYLGRPPTPEDLLLPNYRNQHLRDPVVHANLQRDLETLGLRGRRTHDTRRTFISLALSDGAPKPALREVTHGSKVDVMDLYTTFQWEPLCDAVSRLRLDVTGHDLNVRALKIATPELHQTSRNKKQGEL